LEKIPDAMNFDEASVLEPLGVAYHAVKLSKIVPGESVAIFGCGAIGLLTMAMAKAFGAGETFIADRLQYRLDFASQVYGPDHVINTATDDPVAFVKEKTNGRGVDVSFEAAGEQATFSATFESARIGGRSMLIGIPEVDTISFNPHTARRRELQVWNVRRSSQALKPCIDLIGRGDVKIDRIPTHHFSLDEITRAFEIVRGYQDNVIRAMIRIGE
jgi:L-iditol 2-dehydrogenase